MTMMTQELVSALAARGIDNPEALIERHPADVIERSLEFWDRKRASTAVGPGLLVQTIRRGGPTVAEAPAPIPAGGEAPDWRAWVREQLPDLAAHGEMAVEALACQCAFFAAGRWEVTADLVRSWWRRSIWASAYEDAA